MMMPVRPMLFALTALAVSSATPASASGLRTFRNWLVGCDNTLSCRALGTIADDAGNPAYLVLDRSGGPQAALSLRFMDQNGSVGATGLFYALDGAAPVEIPGTAFS